MDTIAWVHMMGLDVGLGFAFILALGIGIGFLRFVSTVCEKLRMKKELAGCYH